MNSVALSVHSEILDLYIQLYSPTITAR